MLILYSVYGVLEPDHLFWQAEAYHSYHTFFQGHEGGSYHSNR